VSLGLYMDVHVRPEVSDGLRQRGVDVLTAQEERATRLHDPDLLDRASAVGRVLFTQDEDLLAEEVRRQRQGLDFMTVLYAHQLRVPIGRCIDDLELFSKVATAEESRGQVIYLPIRSAAPDFG
jgi:Domain of unknown function (DUF5615)